jgi:hypothetical protein
MSLDGLRAWIGLVERKLTMRTRVFLALVAIAVGGAGAAIVLAIDAQNNAVTKSDLQAVRGELTGTSAPAEAPATAALQSEIETLRSEVAELRSDSAGSTKEPGGESGGTAGNAGEAAATPQEQRQLKEEAEEALERSQGKESK